MTNPTPARRAVQIATAAELFDVSRDTIRGAIRSGDLPAKKVGSRWLIRVNDLDLWFNQLPDEPTAKAVA